MTRISDLPDEMVRLILISAKNAARFSVQSKTFKNLFNIIKNLELVYSKTPFVSSFTDYVNGVLSDLPGSCTRVKKFTLRCQIGLDEGEINRWICRLLNCGVLEMEMNILGDGYTLPMEIFVSETLVKLNLGSEFDICVIPENALLPVLETLVLDSVRFIGDGDRCVFQALLRACPVLKELVIDGMYWESWSWSGVLSCHSLRKLSISRVLSDDFDGPEYQGITFDTPSLESFVYCDFVADAYPVVCFDSLVKAELNLVLMVNHRWRGYYVNEYDSITSNPSNLINGVLYFFRDAIPMFENLRHLTMVTDEEDFCWDFLPVLLEKTPNLRTLHINGCLHYYEEEDYLCDCLLGYSCLLSCHLEVLEISLRGNGDDGELEQVTHFLGKLSHLLLLKVHLMRGLSVKDISSIAADVLALPRASSQCVIEFISTLPTQGW